MASSSATPGVTRTNEARKCALCDNVVPVSNGIRCEGCTKYTHYTCLRTLPGLFKDITPQTLGIFKEQGLIYLCNKCELEKRTVQVNVPTLSKALKNIDTLEKEKNLAKTQIEKLNEQIKSLQESYAQQSENSRKRRRTDTTLDQAFEAEFDRENQEAEDETAEIRTLRELLKKAMKPIFTKLYQLDSVMTNAIATPAAPTPSTSQEPSTSKQISKKSVKPKNTVTFAEALENSVHDPDLIINVRLTGEDAEKAEYYEKLMTDPRIHELHFESLNDTGDYNYTIKVTEKKDLDVLHKILEEICPLVDISTPDEKPPEIKIVNVL